MISQFKASCLVFAVLLIIAVVAAAPQATPTNLFPSCTSAQPWDPAFLVPAYFYPSGSECGGSLGYWDCLAHAARTSPAMFRGGTIIINPDSGPGTSYDSSYGSAIK